MNISEMHVMGDIEAYRKSIGMSYAKLAELIGKDSATIKRQLTETRGGVQLNTAYELAAAIGGEVRFIVPTQSAELSGDEREDLYRQISTLTETVALQAEDIKKQVATIDLLQRRVIAKDERLERKDDLIRQLLIEKGIVKQEK